MMKNIISLLYVMIISAVVAAQPSLQFDKNTHDFGEILEENGPVNFKFEFTNLGTAPVIISNVKASCGCTTPGWTKEPVMPGKRGFIEAQYNPLNRPGSFRKSLTIYSNSKDGNSTVYIQGKVTPKARSLAETLPTMIGNLKMRTRAFNMGNITNNKTFEKKFDIYNNGTNPIEIVSTEAPAYISLSFEPASIAAKSAAKLVISYDATAPVELGYLRDDFKIITNDSDQEVKKLSAIATIREYFPPMTAAEAAEAPKLKFEKTIIEFGTVAAGEPVSAEFSFTNQGRSDLDIRQVKANCNCTKTSVEPSVIKPGQSGKLILTFNTDGRKGVQHQQVSIFSNDPKRSMQMVALRGTVKN